jgi:hypothetical protein
MRLLFVLAISLAMLVPASARDDGRYAQSRLKTWFDGLASSKGLCCSFADGRMVRDVDWDTVAVAGADGQSAVRYRVRVDGEWIVVPPEAVVNEPNKYGPAVVWPYKDEAGRTQIRCFMPSSMS